MNRYIVVRHRVKDYAFWKRSFDDSEEIRREYGLKGGEICRDVEDPLELTVVLEFDNLERARELIRSEELREIMKRAGVVGEPSWYFMEQVARVPELADVAHGRA
jgi:uncharacterized protein (DUF1330 family)